MDEPQLARITVSRQSPQDLGLREIFVALDGEELAILRNGEQVTRDVPAGVHRLRVHNTLFWKHADLDLAAGDHARFMVVNRPGWGTYAMTAVIGAGPVYLTLERDDHTFDRPPNLPA